ncbi:MAG: glycosyltransferase family 4 protein [Planctomycetes bacterium]|nr:glycosyltransferase family 4 protein [Planctomycetota bacterium]
MHLLFDARLLHRPLSGLERIQRNMLRELALRPEITRLRALVRKGSRVCEDLPARVELVEVADTEDILAILLDEEPERRPDVFHMTWFPDRSPRDLFLPEAARASVLTFADAILHRHPEYHESAQAAGWYSSFARALAQGCDRIAAISESAAREAVVDLGADADRVDVAYLAVDPDLMRPLDQGDLRARLERLAVSGDYFVAVGKDYPHKDHRTLFQALARLPGDASVICAGSRVWDRPLPSGRSLDQVIADLGLGTRVRWIEGLADDDVKALLQGSRGLVYPSREEGFGLPPLEAMMLGVPVAAAAAMSLPEVCGDGALLFAPGDAAQLAEILSTLLQGGQQVDAVAVRGRARARQFTWGRCVDATLESYRQAISRGAAREEERRAAPRLERILQVVARCPFRDSSELFAWQERCHNAEQHAWNVEDNRDGVLRQLEEARRQLADAERRLLDAAGRCSDPPQRAAAHAPPAAAAALARGRDVERHRDELLREIQELRRLVPRWSLKRRIGKIKRALASRFSR